MAVAEAILSACLIYLGCGLLERLLGAGRDGDRDPLARQRHRARPAQPLARRAHQRALALQTRVHRLYASKTNVSSASRQWAGIGAGRRVWAETQTCTMNPSADAAVSSSRNTPKRRRACSG